MKKLLSIICITFLLSSCNITGNKNQEAADSEAKIIQTEIDSTKIYKEKAISTLDEAIVIIKKRYSKELTTERTNVELTPLMKNYEALLSRLDKSDSIEVQNYRFK